MRLHGIVDRGDAGAQPVWLAALAGACCHAVSSKGARTICWEWLQGHAIYFNISKESERIQPLEVDLPSGHTIAVSWAPSETTYSVKTFPGRHLRAA
jgi:hypothetical protein